MSSTFLYYTSLLLSFCILLFGSEIKCKPHSRRLLLVISTCIICESIRKICIFFFKLSSFNQELNLHLFSVKWMQFSQCPTPFNPQKHSIPPEFQKDVLRVAEGRLGNFFFQALSASKVLDLSFSHLKVFRNEGLDNLDLGLIIQTWRFPPSLNLALVSITYSLTEQTFC